MSVRSPTKRASQSPAEPARRRFLIVEDNDDARDMLETLLDCAGYEVAVARDGLEAMALVNEQEFDVVLCDIGMPRMDGYQFAEAVGQIAPLSHLRLIAISGYACDSDRRRSAAAGFEAHLAKPVSLRQIEDVVDWLFERSGAPGI